MKKICSFLTKGKSLYMALGIFLFESMQTFAQSTTAGTQALNQATTDIAKYIPFVQKLIYVIAAIIAIIGAVSVFIKMNNDENDVKKSIMLTVGGCIFLISAATALPKFFGY